MSDVGTVRKQVGVLVEDDLWRSLKVYCVQNDLNVVAKAGNIIEEWVTENCETHPTVLQ